jgi:hypothetical protein
MPLTKVVSDAIYRSRLKRMKEEIEGDYPAFLIWSEARLIAACHKMPLSYHVSGWWGRYRPFFLDAEWWKWKITGKSDIYEPLPPDTTDGYTRLSNAILGPNPCPDCHCDARVFAKAGCVCSCHGWESID